LEHLEPSAQKTPKTHRRVQRMLRQIDDAKPRRR
jgi:hypothetical protein